MSWICDKCGANVSYRLKKCQSCGALISSKTINTIVKEEIKVQKAVLGEFVFDKVSYYIKGIEFVLKKRRIINFIVILLSIILISGYIVINHDKEYWVNTYMELAQETKNKTKIITTTFIVKAKEELDTAAQLAGNNSKSSRRKVKIASYNMVENKLSIAISRKSFNELTLKETKSKKSFIELFTNKSFNTIDKSKLLKLEEIKWELISKIQ